MNYEEEKIFGEILKEYDTEGKYTVNEIYSRGECLNLQLKESVGGEQGVF